MNHDAIQHALCGRYVVISEEAGYIQSALSYPEDGTLIGAYVVARGENRVRVTDDGDVIFHVASAGADVTYGRAKRYQSIAAAHGVSLEREGVMSLECSVAELPYKLASFMQAAGEIAALSVKHRPRDADRFESLVGQALDLRYAERVVRRPVIVGISGHQLRFPFALDLDGARPLVIQTVAAENNRVMWGNLYEAGGKFTDVLGARNDLRLVAVLEAAEGIDQARRFLADMSDVVVYNGGELLLAA